MLDPRAFRLFPTTSSGSEQNRNMCVLLGKNVGERHEASDFCECGNCSIQKTHRESVCCREIFQSETSFAANLRTVIGNYNCICEAPDVIRIVDDRFHLELFHSNEVYWKEVSGQPFSRRVPPLDPDRYLRFAAYSMLTVFFHKSLGRFKRVELPSCVVDFIRHKYPSQDGNYTGFAEALHEE